MPDAAKTTSIMPDKFAKGYKGAEDWLSTWITGQVTTTDKKSGKRSAVDVDALFSLAGANGLDTAKHGVNRDSAGFAGRFRMTVRNMLQAVAKRRHGLFGTNGKWSVVPGDWLKAKGAPDAPTEKRNGDKIAKPKANKSSDKESATA